MSNGCYGKLEQDFLKKYVVPNFYSQEHLGLNNEEFEEFKDFVTEWGLGEMNDIIQELLINFREKHTCD
tara:strand:- start:3867 stop:4073 length:207 start_codon:yes stop_codon:yes gene_type:complete